VLDKAAYDELPDGVLVAGPDGRVVVLNPAAERLLGTSADAALGRDFREVLPLSDTNGHDWWDCTDPYDGMLSRQRQPGVPAGPAGRVRGAGHGVLRPRPDRRLVRLVIALRDTRARERLERSRANLVSTVAHELRSPLTSVKGFTATLLAKWERFNDEQKKLMLQTVNADADRVTRLIAELLDVSRIDAGGSRCASRSSTSRPPCSGCWPATWPPARRRAGSTCSAPARCPRCGSTRTSCSRSSATSSRTPCGTATAP
jgi:signal transduction histidine kinase